MFPLALSRISPAGMVSASGGSAFCADAADTAACALALGANIAPLGMPALMVGMSVLGASARAPGASMLPSGIAEPLASADDE